VAEGIDIVAHSGYFILIKRGLMNKTISMSVRVSEDELIKIKKAAERLEYSSYSEFVRRTALLEASKIVKNEKK